MQVSGRETEPEECDHLLPGAVLWRASALDVVGQFDDAFIDVGTIFDYSQRCRNAGWRLLRVPSAIARKHGELDNPDLRPSIARLRDQFSAVWEVSSLSLRIHMVEQGMGVSFMGRELLNEHPQCRGLAIMDDVSFGRIDRQVGLYYRAGKTLSDSAADFIALCQRHWSL